MGETIDIWVKTAHLDPSFFSSEWVGTGSGTSTSNFFTERQLSRRIFVKRYLTLGLSFSKTAGLQELPLRGLLRDRQPGAPPNSQLNRLCSYFVLVPDLARPRPPQKLFSNLPRIAPPLRPSRRQVQSEGCAALGVLVLEPYIKNRPPRCDTQIFFPPLLGRVWGGEKSGGVPGVSMLLAQGQGGAVFKAHTPFANLGNRCRAPFTCFRREK